MPSTSWTASSSAAEVAGRDRRAPRSDSRSGRAAGPRGARWPPPRGPRRGCRPSGRIRSWPRVYGTTQKLQNSLQPSMIVTYAFTGSLRRVTPSGNVTSSNGSRSMTGRRSAAACSTSIGSRRIACVPTMTSATPGERLRSAAPSCCATQPATATIGSCPCSAASCAQLAEPRVELLLGALAHAAGVDDDDVGVGGVVGRLVAGLLEQAGHALGVVDVHLAAERLDQVFARHARSFRFRAFAVGLSLSPFAFDSPFAFASAAARPASISRADARSAVGDALPRRACAPARRPGPRRRAARPCVRVRPPSTRFSIWKCVSA